MSRAEATAGLWGHRTGTGRVGRDFKPNSFRARPGQGHLPLNPGAPAAFLPLAEPITPPVPSATVPQGWSRTQRNVSGSAFTAMSHLCPLPSCHPLREGGTGTAGRASGHSGTGGPNPAVLRLSLPLALPGASGLLLEEAKGLHIPSLCPPRRTQRMASGTREREQPRSPWQQRPVKTTFSQSIALCN